MGEIRLKGSLGLPALMMTIPTCVVLLPGGVIMDLLSFLVVFW
jgi:hypothetical protein